MAEPPMFHKDWVIQINKMLNNEDVNYPAILRVPTPLLDLKPAAYIPQFLSLGPYHHSKIEKDTKSSAGCKISRAEEYKGKTAAMVSQNLRRMGKNFKSVVELMEQMRPDIERFYQWPASTDCEYSQNFTLMMAIDSSFLLRFLLVMRRSVDQFLGEASYTSNKDIIGLGPFQVCTICDIMKLENQVPLSVLRNVFENLKEALIFNIFENLKGIEDFSEVLLKTCVDLPPFVLAADTKLNDANVEKEPHLMGCVHAFVSQFLHVQLRTGDKLNRSLLLQLKDMFSLELLTLVFKFFPNSRVSIERAFLKALTAEQLDRAGIKFEAFNKLPGSIVFDRDSGTLYLPCIHVSDMETEVFFRNMVALEFNDSTRPNCVTRYIALMEYLVRSPDDVRLLKRRGIIRSERLSDECIANMWSGMCQPFFTGELGYQEIIDPLIEVLQKNYLRTKIKRMLLGLFDYVSSWKFIAPLAGFIGLALTAIQAYPVLFE